LEASGEYMISISHNLFLEKFGRWAICWVQRIHSLREFI